MLNPDSASEVGRRRMSIGYDNEFDEAFQAYKERDKRRKSSMLMLKPDQLSRNDSQSTKKMIVLSLIVSVPLLIIILLSIYLRTGSK